MHSVSDALVPLFASSCLSHLHYYSQKIKNGQLSFKFVMLYIHQKVCELPLEMSAPGLVLLSAVLLRQTAGEPKRGFSDFTPGHMLAL